MKKILLTLLLTLPILSNAEKFPPKLIKNLKTALNNNSIIQSYFKESYLYKSRDLEFPSVLERYNASDIVGTLHDVYSSTFKNPNIPIKDKKAVFNALKKILRQSEYYPSREEINQGKASSETSSEMRIEKDLDESFKNTVLLPLKKEQQKKKK
tara:strand:+ start:236 stop:697 length:462 start_codon:yes stop_codon:yes gene_type:complete